MNEMQQTPMLDHGYFTLVETWGSDQRIIESARMSTDKGFLGWGSKETTPCDNCGSSGQVAREVAPGIFVSDESGGLELQRCPVCLGKGYKPGDEKLLKYLWDMKHSTPFEMAGITVEVQAPIAVFREWHRHRIPFGYSELSARYTPMPNLNYFPTVERCMMHSTTNKQAGRAKGADELTEESAQEWLFELGEGYAACERIYQSGLARGIPKELARLIVPVGRYSRMRATGNLRGWCNFMQLRCAKAAQWEIRQYANQIGEVVRERFPRTFEVAAASLGLA